MVILCMDVAHFLHSFVARHLGCLNFSAVVNSAAMNWECGYLFEILISLFWIKYTEVELVDHMVVLFLILGGNLHPVRFMLDSHWQWTTHILPNTYLSFLFLRMVILTLWFWFPHDWSCWCSTSFHILLAICIYSLEKCLKRFFCFSILFGLGR